MSSFAITYEMTEATKARRDGIPYPDAYRQLCAEGARLRRIKNAFKATRDQQAETEKDKEAAWSR